MVRDLPQMAEVTPLSPEVSRSVSALARTLVAAARSWALYPPDHPAVRGSLDRLRTSLGERDRRPGLRLRRDARHAARRRDRRSAAGRGPVAEAARVAARARHPAAHVRRRRAGPRRSRRCSRCCRRTRGRPRAAAGRRRSWAEEGDAAIAVEQIDFSQVLEDREVSIPVRRKDDLWRAIVRGRHSTAARADSTRPRRRACSRSPATSMRDRRAGAATSSRRTADGRIADADVAGGGGRRGLPPPRRASST